MSKPYIPNDKLAKKARKDNFRARSVYKLQELDYKYHLFHEGMKILDVAAAPGSWSQHASSKIGNTGHILAIDIQKIETIAPNVTTAVCDITNIPLVKEELAKLGWNKVDLIMSDIAPSTTGISNVDHSRSIDLNEHIFELAKEFLSPNKKLIMKIFDGPLLKPFLIKLGKHFKKVEVYKAKSSRERSKELYVTCW